MSDPTSERPPSATEQRIRAQSNQQLVINLQRLAKDVTYVKNKWLRSVLLDEAARRLLELDRLHREEPVDNSSHV